MWQIENWAVISICHSLYWREDMLKTKMCRGQATTKFGYDLYAINPIILVSLIKSKKEMKHITQKEYPYYHSTVLLEHCKVAKFICCNTFLTMVYNNSDKSKVIISHYV